ncbi:hypothetical protein DK794_24395 [Escherichia coli]|nr:hypothetical protein [Escherichia coli]EFN7760101.1 hypothetical protein [Escherichia coli]EFO1501327.1 hypothetical protein [Escherichia coli]EFO2310841.1 hypothetical protein [Escherichia coli]EFO4105022.1 hypothetical protein [Escherichia coli]
MNINNSELIWKFCKTDDNQWIWYCHEKNGYILFQSSGTYNSQSLCIENARQHGYSDNPVIPIFIHLSYIHGKGWKWYRCYNCGYIIEEATVFFPTHHECLNDVKQKYTDKF